MNTFPCIKPLYLLIVCCSCITLALVVLVSSSHHAHPSSLVLQQGGSHELYLHDLIPSRLLAEAQGVAENQVYINVDFRISVRKLASSVRVSADLPLHNHQYDDKLNSLLGKTAGRKLLLHSADDHHEMSTTTVTITANGAAKTSANPHDVDESSAFHVDYSGPKTHPPKNN